MCFLLNPLYLFGKGRLGPGRGVVPPGPREAEDLVPGCNYRDLLSTGLMGILGVEQGSSSQMLGGVSFLTLGLNCRSHGLEVAPVLAVPLSTLVPAGLW